MHFSITTLALALASTVSAHTHLYRVAINGADQGDGRKVYIRSPPNNDPVKDLTSPNLVCNVNGGKAVNSFVKASGGDTVTFEWYHNSPGDDIIDLSHKGPISTWIAQYTTGNGVGPIWSKIAEDGFTNGKWAVERLVANKGKIDVKLPAGLAAGKYLIRQEIIAHHESDKTFDTTPARGAQFYPVCVQFDITGSGSVVPNQGFDFNKDYKYTDKGIHFNLYQAFSSYTIPGPAVFSGNGGGSGGGAAPGSGTGTTTTAATTTTGAGAPTGAPTGQPTGQPTSNPNPNPNPGNPGNPQPTTLQTKRRPTVTKTVTVRPTGGCKGGHKGGQN